MPDMIHLTSDAAIMYGLALISAMLACGLWLSRKMLGAVRHAAIWAGAFAIGAVQWAVIGGYNSYFGETPLTFLGSTWCGGLVAILLCMGFRERAGLPRRSLWMAGAALVTLGFVIVPETLLGYRQLTLATPQFTRMVFSLLAAATLIRPGRRPSGVEALSAVILGGLAALSATVGYARIVDCGCETNAGRVILLVGLPVLYTGTGISCVLLLTVDLAGQLRRAARIDPLTELLNRRGFDEAAQRLLVQMRRQKRPSAVLHFDLDHFKAVNDSFGHARGDAVLRAVAACARGQCRPSDVLTRPGGEEFAILLGGASPQDAMAQAERLRAAIAELAVLPVDCRVTASFGAAPVHPEGTPAEALADALDRADLALYRAKSEGRNRVCVHDEARCAAIPQPAPAAAMPRRVPA